jgi:hypothetical protein
VSLAIPLPAFFGAHLDRLSDAIGKLYALCAMYQDMDFLLRPIIEDLEACRTLRLTGLAESSDRSGKLTTEHSGS